MPAVRRSAGKGSRAVPPTDRAPRNTRTRTRPKAAHVPEAKATTTRRQPKKKHPEYPFLVRSIQEIEADPNRRSPLFSLPSELVQQIAAKLPLPSAVCLILTCKEAADTVGTWPWSDFKAKDRWALDPSSPPFTGIGYRQALFKMLLRDEYWGGNFIYCNRCDTLHSPLEPPASHRKTKLTTYCYGPDACIDYLPGDETHGYVPVFQHIADALEVSSKFSAKGSSGLPIEGLAGDFTVYDWKQHIRWRMQSTSRRVDGNLLIEHVHTFQGVGKTPMTARDVVGLPVRLCPHQTTTTALPAPSQYIKSERSNGMLLTYAIATALPNHASASTVDMRSFRKPTPSELNQMAAADAGEDIVWRCRSCPTKFKVRHENGLVVTSWHCFGRDLLHAAKYWKRFVRRAGVSLGTDKRNDEWWSSARTMLDFKIE